MNISTLILLSAIAATPQFEVRPLDGPSVTGTIEAIDAETLTITTEAGPKKLLLRELLAAQPASPPKSAAAIGPVRVELTDGSTFAAQAFTSTKDTARLALPDNQSLEVKTRALKSVRFKDSGEKSSKLDAQWQEMLGGEHAADLLVVRKKGAIDSTEGVVGEVNADAVKFTLDGDQINVKREKIEGIVFAKHAAAELPEALCTVSNASGARLNVATLVLKDGSLEITTPAGLKTSLPLAAATQLDFSSGKVAYLGDLEPESFTYQPFFSVPTDLPSLGDFYNLRRNASFENSTLKLDGKQYTKGIALHSRSKVVYRLPSKFRSFTAIVGIDDEARDGGGDVAAEILGDGKSLWSARVRGADPAQPITLDITGMKKLEIIADYGEGQDVADHLDLCDAKVTK